MAKTHVPKFGNWDGDNVPYTSYFDSTRKGKGTAGKSFNPNDPQENPDAFLSVIFPAENEATRVNRQQYKLHGSNDDDGEFDKEYAVTPRRGRDRKNGSSGYGADASAENTPESSYHTALPLPLPSPMRAVLKSENRSHAMHKTPSSVLRFGSWDDANPDFGDGFTMIFNKVKQEKQMAANKAPRAPPAAPKVHSRQRSNRPKSSAKSKISCCFLPSSRV